MAAAAAAVAAGRFTAINHTAHTDKRGTADERAAAINV
jgi:hypothetical protein